MATAIPAEQRIPQYEWLDRELIRQRQEKKLAAVLSEVRRTVPYYQSSFASAGLPAHEVAGFDALGRLPLITKADIRDHAPGLFAVDDPVDFVSSSGTAGRPLILPVDRAEEHLRIYPIQRVLSELELGPGDRVLHNFNMFALYVIGYYSALAIREQGCAIIRTGPSMEERQLDVIAALKPNAFVANPFFMLSLAEMSQTKGIDPRGLGLRKAMLATATPFGSDLQPRDIRLKLEEAWNLTLTVTHYGSSEIGPIGYECRFHQGYHVHEDVIHVERLDPQSLDPVSGDSSGELVVTHLDPGRGFTAVRYRTGDLIAWSTTEPCLCGRRTLRLGPVIGRVDQQVKLRGQNLVPDFLLALVDGVPGVAVTVIEAFRRPDTGEDWLRIKAGVDDVESSGLVEQAVRAKIAGHIPTDIPIEVVPAEVVRRQQQESAAKTGGNKISRFFDLR